MSRSHSRRTFIKRTGAAAALVGTPGYLAQGQGAPDVLMIVAYPQSGVQLFKDYYADYGDDDTTILVTDGLQESSLPSDVGDDLSNVRGTAPSAAGPGRDAFAELYRDEFESRPSVFTAQAYDATAVQVLANALAGENDGTAVRDHMRVVANPGGETYQPGDLPAAVEAAAAGENVQYEGASSTVDFDDAGDVASAQYEVFTFDEEEGIATEETVEFEESSDVPEPEPQGDGSESGRTVRFGVLQPETGDLGPLGGPIADAATLPARQLSDAVDFEFDFQVADTQSTAQAAVSGANSLVSAGYPSITGAAGSESTIQVARNVLIRSQVVGCSPASTSPIITGLEDDDYVFRTAPSDALQGQVLAQVSTEDVQAETASTLYLNNSYGQALQESFVESFEEAGGSVQQQVGFEQQQSSYTSEINRAMGG